MKNRMGNVALLVLSIVAAGCVSSDAGPDGTVSPTTTSTVSVGTTTSEGGEANVFEVPDQVIDQAADALKVNKDAVEVLAPFTFGSSQCFLVGAFTPELLDAGASFAVLENGDVYRQGGDDDAVSAVLEGCFFGAGNTITAQEWAELIARLDDTPARLGVVTAEVSYFAEDLGVTWSAPQIKSEGDKHTLHFLASGIDFGDVYAVTAVRAVDGTFSSSYELVAAG